MEKTYLLRELCRMQNALNDRSGSLTESMNKDKTKQWIRLAEFVSTYALEREVG